MDSNSGFEKGSVVALGNFDGLHSGHRAVINSALELAQKLCCTPCILLFSEHSQKSLRGSAPTELFSGEIKQRVLKETTAKIITIDFKEIKDMSTQAFFEDVLLNQFNAKGICCGFDYRFGKNAQGNIETLEQLCKDAGVALYVSPPKKYRGMVISSTRIRTALEEGEIEQANDMLERDYSYKEVVIDGDKRGRILGKPTINQILNRNMTIPRHGVYASYTIIKGKRYASVTNIGVRPTIGTGVLGSETYIIGFEGDLYGKSIEVSLLKYLRGEQKFKNLQELSEQIEKDAKTSKNIFETQSNG